MSLLGPVRAAGDASPLPASAEMPPRSLLGSLPVQTLQSSDEDLNPPVLYPPTLAGAPSKGKFKKTNQKLLRTQTTSI